MVFLSEGCDLEFVSLGFEPTAFGRDTWSLQNELNRFRVKRKPKSRGSNERVTKKKFEMHQVGYSCFPKSIYHVNVFINSLCLVEKYSFLSLENCLYHEKNCTLYLLAPVKQFFLSWLCCIACTKNLRIRNMGFMV